MLNKIRELRESRKETQEEVGKILGISQKMYSYYESSPEKLKRDMIKKLCLHWGISSDFLLDITSNPSSTLQPPSSIQPEAE